MLRLYLPQRCHQLFEQLVKSEHVMVGEFTKVGEPQ